MHSLRYTQEDDPMADPSVQVIGWSLRGAGKGAGEGKWEKFEGGFI